MNIKPIAAFADNYIWMISTEGKAAVVDPGDAAPVIAEYFMRRREELGDIVVVSPDVGNVKVANMYANSLQADLAIVDKRRQSGSQVIVKNLVGDVRGRNVIMFDDMISTAGTVCEAARVVMEQGALGVEAACTHALLVGLAMQRLLESPIRKVVTTDTIPGGTRLDVMGDRIELLTVAPLLAEAVHRIHHDQSVSALFRTGLGAKR